MSFIRSQHTVTIVFVLVAATAAFADQIQWPYPPVGGFTIHSNWSGGQVPGPDDQALFSQAGTTTVQCPTDWNSRNSWLFDGQVTIETPCPATTTTSGST